MAFEFNPRGKLGDTANGLIEQSIIIGLPSESNPIPNYVIGTTTTEKASISSTLPGMTVTDGDLVQKSAEPYAKHWFTFQMLQKLYLTRQQVKYLIFQGLIPHISLHN